MEKEKVLITGGTSGLGFELAKIFSNNGYNVWITGRTLKKGLPEGIRLNFVRADFSDLKQTAGAMKELAGRGIRFDIIINNAGILGPPDYTKTIDGYETIFQINFLSHLLVNIILTADSNQDRPVTIVTVTSPVYRYVKPVFRFPKEEDYNSFRVYAYSKYLLLVAADYLKKRLPEGTLKIIKFSPGVFSSGIYRSRGKIFQTLYELAAPFMRHSEVPARKLFELLQNKNYSENMVYRGLDERCMESPVLTPEAEKFLLICEDAVSFLR